MVRGVFRGLTELLICHIEEQPEWYLQCPNRASGELSVVTLSGPGDVCALCGQGASQFHLVILSCDFSELLVNVVVLNMFWLQTKT